MRVSKLFLGLFILFLGLSNVFIPFASAESDDFNGFSISPLIIKEKGQPNETLSNTFTVFNDTDKPVKLDITVRDFEMKGKNIIYKDDVPLEWSVKEWTKVNLTDNNLMPNSSKDIPYTIEIPNKSEMGEHMGLISVKFIPTESTSGKVKVATEILPVLYVSVTDENGNLNVEKEWTLKSLEVDRINGGQITFNVKNDGNVHLESSGTIKLKNLINGEVNKIDIPVVNLLPHAEKNIIVDWEPKDSFGIYNSQINFSMDGDKYKKQEMLFIVIPWMSVIFIALVVLLLVFGLKMYKKRLKEKILNELKKEIKKNE